MPPVARHTERPAPAMPSLWSRTVRRILATLSLGVLASCGGSGGSDDPPSSASVLFGPVGAVSDECVVDDDCRDGFCDRTVPGGYCTTPCDVAAPCPAGSHCAFGYCFATCESRAECRSDEFQCYEAEPELGVCSLDVDAVQPTEPNIGAPCRATVECAAPGELEAYCISEVDLQGEPTRFVGGMCVALGCESDADCGPMARCVPGSVPYCVPSCTGSEQCRPGYGCDETIGGCGP